MCHWFGKSFGVFVNVQPLAGMHNLLGLSLCLSCRLFTGLITRQKQTTRTPRPCSYHPIRLCLLVALLTHNVFKPNAKTNISRRKGGDQGHRIIQAGGNHVQFIYDVLQYTGWSSQNNGNSAGPCSVHPACWFLLHNGPTKSGSPGSVAHIRSWVIHMDWIAPKNLWISLNKDESWWNMMKLYI